MAPDQQLSGSRETLTSFQDLKDRRKAVASRCEQHLQALSSFQLGSGLADAASGEVQMAGFSHLAQSGASAGSIARVSIASTATCLMSLDSSEYFRAKRNVTWAPLIDHLSARMLNGNLQSSGLSPDNPFTIGLLLMALRAAGASSDSAIVRHCINVASSAVSDDGVSIFSPRIEEEDLRAPDYAPHGYLTYWCLRGLEEWQEGSEEARIEAVRGIGAKCLAWSSAELYRQSALFTSRADDETDAYQLGYNAVIQHRYCRGEVRDTVIAQSLRILFDAQLSRGVWEKKAPLFVYGGKGDAHCFAFELMNTIFDTFRNEWKILVDHEDHLDRFWGWLNRNAIVIDRSRRPAILGWRSGDVTTAKAAESWATAEVYRFLQYYRDYLSWRIQQVILGELRGRSYSEPNSEALRRLYHPEVALRGQDSLSLGDLIENRIINPLKVSSVKPEYTLAKDPNRDDKIRSGILFGPPGTGKTTYVSAVAKRLGWPLIVLDPSSFASKGLSLIASETSRVFEALMELEDCVIFFDEMEELVRSRQNEGGTNSTSFEQRYVTTSLLPRIQELRSHARTIFFLATNHFHSIDDAIRREGRFDFRLQILPPSFSEKMRMISDELGEAIANAFHDAASDATRKRKIVWATRLEMLSVVAAIKSQVSPVRKVDVESLIDNMNPRLLDEQEAIIADSENNSFG